MLDRLWAGWRSRYVQGTDPAPPQDIGEGDGTLFERILGADLPEDQTWIVHRGDHVSVLLNAFPYGSGHVMVVPNRAVIRLAELTSAETRELWDAVDQAVAVIEAEYQPQGINVGLNQGKAAGAGVPDHLHVHVLPRWNGDTNFMTSIAETRVLPEPIGESWRRLNHAWDVTPNRLDR